MLKGIKDMINQKKLFQEAAEIIMEDASGYNLDDVIVLGEESEFPEEKDDKDDKDEPEKDDDNDDIGNMEIGEDDDDDKGHTSNKPSALLSQVGEPSNDLLDSDISDKELMGLPKEDNDLPTPVGAQTGEPINAGLDDILDVTIDLRSNTLKDTLPIPPANAGEAIASDDILSQKVDSGFGEEDDHGPIGEDGEDAGVMGLLGDEEEESANILDSPIDDIGESGANCDDKDCKDKNCKANKDKKDNDVLTEAITLGGKSGDTDDTAGDPPADDQTTADAGAADTGTEESPVTSAVRDKVAELDTQDDLSDTATGGEGSSNQKDELLKKLGNITKNLEDAKKAIMNCL